MNRLRALAISLALVCAVIFACGRENALVGGECAPGYGDNPCPDGSSNDGPSSDGPNLDGQDLDGQSSDRTNTGDGPGDGAPIFCDDGLVPCNGTCIDTTSDPYNCGGCGIICPSLLCANSLCVGSVPGSYVAIGHDYETSFSAAQKRVLSNAALITQAMAIRVLSYEQYAAPLAVTNVKSIITTAATGQGRSVVYTATSQPSDVATMTVLKTDVLIVYSQTSAPPNTLATIGAGWTKTLTNFTHVGGIVVVLDGSSGANPQMPALMTAAGIFNMAASTPMSTGSPLFVVAPGDAVGFGVISPYGAGNRSAFFTCNDPNGGAVTYVVENPAGDAAATQPVVIHKVAP